MSSRYSLHRLTPQGLQTHSQCCRQSCEVCGWKALEPLYHNRLSLIIYSLGCKVGSCLALVHFGPAKMPTFLYPSPTLEADGRIKWIRIARHCPCISCGCQGLHPGDDQEVEIGLEQEDADFTAQTTKCACGHSWLKHGALDRLVDGEINRRARVALRIDEFLDVSVL